MESLLKPEDTAGVASRPSASAPSLAPAWRSRAKVEPLLTTRNVRGPFDYRLPPSMAGVGVGSILVVPFGRRRVKGVVVDLAESSELPDSRLAEPYEALEAGVPAELVELGRWLADEYCSTPARGLGLTLPPGTGTGSVARRVRPLIELEAEITAEGERALTGTERLGLRQKAALRALLAGPQPARRLATVAGAERATIRRLEERGLVATREVERRRRPAAERVGAVNEGVELNEAQREAADRVARGRSGEGGSLLLSRRHRLRQDRGLPGGRGRERSTGGGA